MTGDFFQSPGETFALQLLVDAQAQVSKTTAIAETNSYHYKNNETLTCMLSDGKYCLPCRFSTMLHERRAELTAHTVIGVDKLEVLFFHEDPVQPGQRAEDNVLSTIIHVKAFSVLFVGSDVKALLGTPVVYDHKKKSMYEGLSAGLTPMESRVPFVCGVVAEGTSCEQVDVVQCVGDLCGETHTGFYQDKCVVLAQMESYRDDGKLWHTEGEPEGELQLPPCESPFIMKMTKRWLQNRHPSELEHNRHRRFLLYYYFACEVFGATDRIRLPACVVSAVRAMYPNPPGEAYVGHRDV